MSLARRVGALVFALLLVSTVTLSGVVPGASPSGTASAELSEECSLTGIGDGWELAYNTLTGNDDGCHWDDGSSVDYTNVTATDAYASSLALKDSYESYTTTTGNFMTDTRTVAYSKAKITLINELNNGSTVSVAQAAVNDTVEDYYSRVQKEALKDWNAKAQQMAYLDNETNLTIDLNQYNDAGWSGMSNFGNYYTSNVTATLANGSTMTVKIIEVSGGTNRYGPVGGGSDSMHASFHAIDPDDSTREIILSTADYGHLGSYYQGMAAPANHTENSGQAPKVLVSEAVTQKDQVLANMDPYVDEVYAQYAVGELNSTDLATIDPAVIGQEATTELDSTGYYGHASIMLASIGASGDLNASHTVETGDGTTLNGTLFYTGDDAPMSGFATNRTYNFSDYNGTFYFAVQKDDGNASIADLSNYGANFTITEALNTQTGEEMNATVVETYTYDSTNASALADEIDRLRELRQEYEEELAASGDSSSGSGLSTKVIGGAILVGAAAVLLIQREGRQ